MLNVLRLTDTAVLPTVAHPGEDVAYDIYSDEETVILPQSMKAIKTGIAIEFKPKAGAQLLCRSSMAKMEASIEGGVIDSGYRGEIIVMVRNNSTTGHLVIRKGAKLAQFTKLPVVNAPVREVKKLTASKRGAKGFGSSGK